MNEWDVFLSVSPGETRIAWADQDGVLRRYEIDRPTTARLHGAIFRARVARIEKGMGGAFLDLGSLDSAGGGEALLPRAKDAKGRPLTEGQWLVAQVSKEAHGTKGPAVTAKPMLTGRALAYRPYGRDVEFERALGKGKARGELERAVADNPLPTGGGWLVRAGAAGLAAEALTREAQALTARWAEIQAANDGPKPRRLAPPPDSLQRLLVEAAPGCRIAVDDRQAYAALLDLAAAQAPDLLEDLLFHDAGQRGDLFETVGLADQIEEAFARRVPLSGGGALVIDQTEALTVIDIDMGDSVGAAGGAGAGGDAAVRLNVRAATEAARQIQLRNIAGQIVLDCVTMRNRGEAKKVLEALRRGFKGSPVAVDILGLTPGGLIEIVRQRTGRRLDEIAGAPMSMARRLSPESLALAALRDALRLRGAGRPVLTADPAVIACLEGPLSEALAETNQRLGQELRLVAGDSPVPTATLERDR
ncbi:MAG: ribonuclease E/G [Alphaproteobacteria bacterium]|nr:ribonuclease E/G [Alphaproteobacteria bacterium]